MALVYCIRERIGMIEVISGEQSALHHDGRVKKFNFF